MLLHLRDVVLLVRFGLKWRAGEDGMKGGGRILPDEDFPEDAG